MSGRRALLLAAGLALFLGGQHFAGCACDDGGGDDPGPTPCLNDGDCGADQLCNDDTGECFAGNCREDRDCGTGSACKDSWCSGTCTADGDCQAESGNSDAACYLHVCYGMEETCGSTEDCAQPLADLGWVTCSDLKGKCVPAIPSCSRESLETDCPANMVCKGADGTCETGVCAERPPQCMTDCDCPAKEICDTTAATCKLDTSCPDDKRPDPVDGVCRKKLCDTDRDCADGEWCDHFFSPGCRKDCNSDAECVTAEGEECQDDHTCRQAVLCAEDEDCASCACKSGLVCAVDHRIGDKKCRRACDIFDNDCANQGELCQPVLDGGTYPRAGGACQLPNGGGTAGAACDPTNHCEANLICQNLTCRAICNPSGEPGCTGGVDCTAYLGIGVCGDVIGCGSDLECNPPAEVCWNQECQPGCDEASTPITCDAGKPCDPATGRCEGSGGCTFDADCSPPDRICNTDLVPPDCAPGCLSTGCPGGKACDQTSGRCKDKCLGDDDCIDPPKEVCEHDACVKGCNEAGGLDCGQQDCMANGHCGQVDYCSNDQDCNPPMSRCDEAWGQCEDGCGLTGCDTSQGYVCENTSGDCVYSPCDHIGCPCDSTADCATGLFCGMFSKQCTKSCSTDADCSPFYCNGGFCG